jgi:hypothetical protein
VVKYSHVKSFDTHGKRYHYVKRPGFPVVRIRAEPGSLEFDTIYDLVMRAQTVDEIKEIRKRVGMKMSPRVVIKHTEVNTWVKSMEEKYGIK